MIFVSLMTYMSTAAPNPQSDGGGTGGDVCKTLSSAGSSLPSPLEECREENHQFCFPNNIKIVFERSLTMAKVLVLSRVQMLIHFA